ncbi:SLAIN motif-containing protein 1-like isoform X4 [Betta splendens]|uniref:SLAIN motif-containing protein 1-like isoform X4 n=1 Tax=Betta splendens TaxID=158456 RepID=A0A6P7LVZ1_BETSP|nr:SLAIN motif-containing protein 1-like isoform X4 [Betta splendens]
MEASVMNLAMMTELDCNSNTLNAELEVKKLQELVRQLERQNEQLRTRASCCFSGDPHALPPSPPCDRGGAGGYCFPTALPGQQSLGAFAPLEYFHPQVGDGAGSAAAEVEDGAEASVLDDLELLDLDSLCSMDKSDETWLYSPSKSTDPTDDSVTPLQWCRQVLDSPKSEVEAARQSLSLRLEQVSRWRSTLSSTSPSSSPGPSLNRVTGLSPISTPPCTKPCSKPCSTPRLSETHAPSLSSPLHPILHRTLSPVGKELCPVAERTPTFLPHPTKRSHSLWPLAFSPQSSMDSDLGASEVEDDSIALGYRLQDLTDVQVMARLQEESLRQDYASTTSILANRRSQSFNFQLSQLGPGLEEEDEEDDEDYGLLPPPQPRLTRLPHSHTISSVRDWRRSTSSLSTPPSTPSTPPYPSAGYAFQPPPQAQPQGLGLELGLDLGSLCGAELQGLRQGSDKLRRSMPNLVRAPSIPSVPMPTNFSASSSLLRNSQSFDSSSGLARLQSSIPSPGQLHNRVQSVGNFASLSRQPLKATAYVSPTIKGCASMLASTSLQSLSSGSSTGVSSSIPLLSKPSGGLGLSTSTPATPRSSLPRPASCTASSTPRSKMVQPAQSLLTPPKTLSTLSALRDSTWKDGCY